MTDFLIGLTIVGVSVGISLAVSVPFAGALVRVRANYNPKSLQLDEEGVVQPYTGPQITSFFGMLARVKRIEGWPGLYKGAMPSLVSSMILGVFILSFFDASTGRPRLPATINPPDAGPFGLFFFTIFWIVVSLPSLIITNRAITTPYKLPYFKPLYSLRILLTPTERRRPWLIFLTPGLLTSQVLAAAYAILILGSLRKVILPVYRPGEPFPTEGYTPLRLGLYLIVVIVSTVVLTPLEVISTKLSIQRNHALSEYNSVSQEVEGDPEETIEYSGTEEDVIGLRNERDPYTSLIDCGKRIIDEEGLSALYRAWWLTLLICLFTSL